ncbi:acetylxylan esterase [Planotetraspora kaengkrachanensis]|uniref:Acetylxylan esterase n=1 Tax=Planotetraspora kaengkrachanensis TaxID=575193 RepID=A0A8J3LW94_9ACTN|nr:acetylxylan esterase [Planotetraspora kaengkrachanensis]GIG78989.1 acetylxylan esterase [Planotetraspora kaengkrachanensis]
MTAGPEQADLWTYRSGYETPADFDAFWRGTLDAAASHPLDLTLAPVATRLRTIDVFDVTFRGFGGDPVRAWLRVPRHRSGPLPAVVQYHGYASGRGHPLEDLLWPSAGYAHLLMDTRGQGGAWAGGHTPDPVGSGPSYPGFMTRGITAKETYFYRRVFTDAVRAVEAVRAVDLVDPARVSVVGASQGGGIALAAAGLVPDLRAVHLQAPLLCDIRQGVRQSTDGPYLEIAGYLGTHRGAVADVFATLAYFDGIAFAQRATAPAWFSTGLMDQVCPPATAFAAFHAYAGPKEIRAWEFNGHEAGGSLDLEIALDAFHASSGTTGTADDHGAVQGRTGP